MIPGCVALVSVWPVNGCRHVQASTLEHQRRLSNAAASVAAAADIASAAASAQQSAETALHRAQVQLQTVQQKAVTIQPSCEFTAGADVGDGEHCKVQELRSLLAAQQRQWREVCQPSAEAAAIALSDARQVQRLPPNPLKVQLMSWRRCHPTRAVFLPRAGHV